MGGKEALRYKLLSVSRPNIFCAALWCDELLYLVVVPPVEEDPHDEEAGVLVGARVAQQEHPLGRHGGQQVGGGGVHQGDPHTVQWRHPLLTVPLHLQCAVLKRSHSVYPGLLKQFWSKMFGCKNWLYLHCLY